MKILVVGARGIPDVEGGAEKNAERLFPFVVKEGHDVSLMGLSGRLKSSNYKGVTLVRAPGSNILNTDKILYYIYALGYFLKMRPDIVHFQGLGAAVFLFLYKALGAKTVVRYGSADYVIAKWGMIGRLGFRLSEWQLRFADAVIAVGPALERRLLEKGIQDNVHVIPNAIDDPVLPSPPPQLPSVPYILAVGRVTPQKNYADLIRGFEHFQKQTNQTAKLLIVGGAERESYLQELMAMSPSNVEFTGTLERSKLGHYYENATVFINSSTHEGCSNSVLEAVSYNAPVLLSDIPENRDLGLRDDQYFVPSDPAFLAAAMQRVFSGPQGYRVPPSRFLTWDEVAQRTIGVYSSLFTSPNGIGKLHRGHVE